MIIYQIKKRHLKKDKWFKALEEEKKGIREEIEKYLDNKGVVFGRKKGGYLKALMFLKATDGNGKKLEHEKDVFLKEVDNETKEKIITSAKQSAAELVSMCELDEVVWDDEKIEQKKVSIGKKSTYALGPLLLILGLILFIVTDDILWMSLGLLLGLLAGATTVQLNKPKKKNAKKRK